MQLEISDYDKTKFNYQKYWMGRKYENLSEQIALSKLLPNSSTKLIDLGGGFGRFAKLLSARASTVLILDYSQKMLDQARLQIEQSGVKNVECVLGDLYQIPFGDNVFETAILIRVFHHLIEPAKVISEIKRILKPKGVLILEYANKIHFKTRIKKYLRGDFYFCKTLTRYKQPHVEGIDKNGGIFYNFHPKYVKQIMTKAGFQIEKKLSVSNFRLPLIKKTVPLPLILFLENLLQTPLAWVNFGPSIFLKCQKISKLKTQNSKPQLKS